MSTDPPTSAARRSCADPNRHYGACGSKNSGGCLDVEPHFGFREHNDPNCGACITEWCDD